MRFISGSFLLFIRQVTVQSIKGLHSKITRSAAPLCAANLENNSQAGIFRYFNYSIPAWDLLCPNNLGQEQAWTFMLAFLFLQKRKLWRESIRATKPDVIVAFSRIIVVTISSAHVIRFIVP